MWEGWNCAALRIIAVSVAPGIRGSSICAKLITDDARSGGLCCEDTSFVSFLIISCPGWFLKQTGDAGRLDGRQPRGDPRTAPAGLAARLERKRGRRSATCVTTRGPAENAINNPLHQHQHLAARLPSPPPMSAKTRVHRRPLTILLSSWSPTSAVIARRMMTGVGSQVQKAECAAQRTPSRALTNGYPRIHAATSPSDEHHLSPSLSLAQPHPHTHPVHPPPVARPAGPRATSQSSSAASATAAGSARGATASRWIFSRRARCGVGSRLGPFPPHQLSSHPLIPAAHAQSRACAFRGLSV